MIKKALTQYINNNATFGSRQRAKDRFPVYQSNEGNGFFFGCSGAYGTAYEIFVDLSITTEINSSCNCPYSGEGICKHQIAAIERLIDLFNAGLVELNSDEKPKKKSKKPISTTTYIPNENGIINTEKLREIEFREQSHYYMPLTIDFIDESKIEANFNGFRDLFHLSLNFDQSKSKLALDCSCKNHFPCSHKFLLLEVIIQEFGYDYFHKDYQERVKKRVMKESKYEGMLEFDDVYELEISVKGVNAKEKVSNIVGIDDTIIQLYEDEAKDFFIPKKAEKKINYGVGLAFKKYNNHIVEVFPFYGKMDKSQTKIATKIRAIDEYNFSETLSLVEDKESQAFITKGIQLAGHYLQENHDDFSLENTKAMIGLFLAIIEDFPNQPLFLYNSRKTLIKKYLVDLKVRHEKVVPLLKIKENKPFYQLDFKVIIENKTYKISSNKLLVLPFGVVLDDVLYPIKNPEVAYSLLRVVNQPQMNVIDKGLDHLRTNVIDPFSKVFEIDFSEIKKSTQKTKPEKIEKHLYLSDEEGEYIVFHPVVNYANTLVSPESMEKIWKNNSKLSYIERNEALESDFLSQFRAMHPNFEQQSNYFYLTVEEALDSMWLMEAIDQLQENDIHVFGLNELKSIRYNLNKPTFSIGFSSGTDWFDMKIDISFGDQKVDLKQIRKSIIKQSNYVELKDGSIGIIPKQWIEKYKKYFKLGQVKKDKIEISNYQFNIIDELYEEETNTPKFLEELYEKKKRLANLKDLKMVSKPKHLKATLRPYQKEGLNWLVFLHENQLGGCLADDMGLGKTLQAIAFIQYLKNLPSQNNNLPHLVVAPTSLMFNWLGEFKKFAPKLKVLSFIGLKRNEQQKEIANNDVVLTTYGSIIKDIEFHRTMSYNYVILDESQAIKNPQSQRFKTVRLLKSNNRLVLTGTPIENNTFDLYSQFSFLNPGIFGSIKHFRSTFSEAIDKDQDEYTSDLLARMIHPFMLRRTKTQVAKELPTKTEAVIYCEMGKEQRKVYDYFKQYFREKLQEQIEDEGINKSQMYILQGLTKLRQICNSTALADKEKDYGSESIKMDELVRHVKEKVNMHKLLVFSQFVGMLHLVKERLEQEGIRFEYLDGQTRNREEKVNNFQNNDEIRVFLISLKAGGTGLNLTEADYVYLIDPWWNPAVESQAIDRCYRIGQDKKVMAYRMICKDTIEEKIVQLQDKKKAVATDVIRVDTEKKSFNKNDVESFFGLK